jgi:hypothetical protein
MEFSQTILDALGGGLPAVVTLGAAWWAHNRQKHADAQSTRADGFADKLLDLSRSQTDALHALTRQIELGGKI